MTTQQDPDFGRRLRQAREARGLPLRQIAGNTKISIGVLEALERGDFSKVPGGIFGRAFVRSYAQEVGLDPDETVRDFVGRAAAESPSSPSQLSGRPVGEEESFFESRRRMAGVFFKLVLISLPIAALLLYFTIGRSRPPAPVPASVTPADTTSPPEAVVRAETDLRPVVPPPEPALPTASVDHAETSVPAPDPSVALASAGEGFLLEVETTAPCWVSLTVDGRVVLSKVMNAEEKVARRVRTGALIQIGDAGAFTFSINGQPARPLGDSGQVKSVQITPANYASFLR